MEHFEKKRLKELREINLIPHKQNILKELSKGALFYELETRKEKFFLKTIIPLFMARDYRSKLLNIAFAIPKSPQEWDFELQTIFTLNIVNIKAKEDEPPKAYIIELISALSSTIKEEIDEVRKLNVQPFLFNHKVLYSILS